MQINNNGMNPINRAHTNQSPTNNEQGRTVSFQTFLQERISAQESKEQHRIESVTTDINELYELDRVETIAARSRVQQNVGYDVSEFLGIIKTNDFILTGVDVKSQAPLNEGSSGNKSLTTEQAGALRETFNIENLSPKEQYSLFQKLTELGALTKDDVMKTKLSVTPETNDLMENLASESEFKDVLAIDETNPKGRLNAMIHNERFAYTHVQQRFGRHCGNVADLADSHQRVLDSLNQL